MIFDRAGEGSDYERLIAVQDKASGLRAFIAIHSTARGPGAGGIRRRPYESEEAALSDALKLAHGMSLKNALAELPAGGAKTTIIDAGRLDRGAAYRAIGRAIEALHGDYLCGPDVGTGEAEMAIVREQTRHANPVGNDPNHSTALGVLAGIRGAIGHLDGTPELADKVVAVQGLGGVGGALARLLRDAGAQVIGADPDAQAYKSAQAAGVALVDVDEILQVKADVLAPCALGGILHDNMAAKFGARAVCGSANNQLGSAEAAAALAKAGVTYVPDFMVNPGAAIEGVLTLTHGDSAAVRAQIREHIARIEDTTRLVLRRADAEGRLPNDIALALAKERLSQP